MQMTVNQLAMHNLAPRGVASSCVPTTIKFLTGECYQDIVEIIKYEQAKFREGTGVHSTKFLGTSRAVFGCRFTKVYDVQTDRRLTVGTALGKFPEGSYYVTIPRHAFAFRDGEIFDLNWVNLANPVLAIWKVEKL